MHHSDCLNPTDCWREINRLFIALWITLIILGLELSGGLISGSLAFLADAGHVLIDKAAVIIAIMAVLLIKYDFDQRRGRATAFYSNIALLWCAVDHFNHPENIQNSITIMAAAAGWLGNFIQRRILKKSPGEHKIRFTKH